VKPMSCPTHDELNQLLAVGDAHPWQDHVDQCSICLRRLAELSDDAELRSWRRSGDLPDENHLNAPPRPLPYLDPPLRPGDLGSLGRYAVEAELGRGGMGVVFRAVDLELRRTVALKILRPAADDAGTRARLLREARALAQLRHPNIIQIHSVEQTASELPYLVMEYVDGPSLSEGVDDERVAAALIAAAADGVQAAHDAGFIHRDVKPSNVLLLTPGSRTGSDASAPSRSGLCHPAIPKITDFGLVRASDASATASSTLAGTPSYMSPEQISAPDTVDTRADVYGLGATLYELLARVPPFRGMPHQVMQRVLGDEPVPLRRLDARISRDLEVICGRAMAKPAARRYPTARALADDLRNWLGGRPIQARPLGIAERCFGHVRRRPLVAVLAVVLAIALIAVIALLSHNRRRANRDLRRVAAAMRSWVSVSERLLRTRSGLTRSRLEELRDSLREQVAIQSDEPALMMAAAATRYQIGIHLAETGPGREAKRELEGARDMFLRAGQVGESTSLIHAAAANIYLADTDITCGWYDDAVAAIDAARALLTGYDAAGGDLLTRRRNLGLCDELTGDVDHARGQWADAERRYRSAQTVYDSMLAEYPNTTGLAHRRAATAYRLGRLLLAVGRHVEAEVELTSARSGMVHSVLENPDDIFFSRDLARVDLSLAEAKSRLGNTEEADALLRSAIQTLQTLAERCPDVHGIHAELARGCRLRAAFDRAAGRGDDAKVWSDRARSARDAASKINPDRLPE
jgi:tetratricopeptide (TPR) repeat protein